MALLLKAASRKAQTPNKALASPNADMTFTRPFGMLVLDGVGGMIEQGMPPEMFPAELRARVRENLTWRNKRVQPYDRDAYDRKIGKIMGAPVQSNMAAAWFKNLIAHSISQCECPGYHI